MGAGAHRRSRAHADVTDRRARRRRDSNEHTGCDVLLGPGCNGSTRAALEFAKLGYRVNEMIGGYEYWAREGYPVENDHSRIIRSKDPLTVPLDSVVCDC